MVAVLLPVFNLTARHAFCTAANADWLPERVSPGRRMPPLPSTSTQRRWPELTSEASHEAVTVLSRPENPPRPATSAALLRIAAEAVLWLSTPIVPPPWALA